MSNFNYLTNAVGGGGATSHNTYYNASPSNFGEYGYIYLTEVIDNFVATYTGTGKILQNVMRGDISFHAHRALQELSYDTLRSAKSQEIEVCPSLKMPLPHDYVNHVKLTTVDANGVEHILYPLRHTSNPFAISQSDGCSYDMKDGMIKHQESCAASTEATCNPDEMNAWIAEFFGSNAGTFQQNVDTGIITFPYTPIVPASNVTETFNNAEELYLYISGLIDTYCECMNSIASGYSCGESVGWVVANVSPGLGSFDQSWWDAGSPLGGGWTAGPWNFPGGIPGTFIPTLDANGVGPIGFSSFDPDGDGVAVNGIANFNTDASGNKHIDLTGLGMSLFIEEIGDTIGECTIFSNTWNNYSTSSGTSTTTGVSNSLDPAVDNSNYFTNSGERYGLEPEHAQSNGSYFIDYASGNIHFGSTLSGKTIILKYISDGHGTLEEQIVPKLAEEAMYKWIAYGCAQARSDVDGGTIARFKKEKFAETRKAKIRLSNIKIEEISQVMRGKSKWIKH